MSALAAMQDKNAHLENSLSAENRLKQDLFSALGEAKRQIEIHQGTPRVYRINKQDHLRKISHTPKSVSLNFIWYKF